MVRDVFTHDAIARLIGGMGIGHGEHLSGGSSRSLRFFSGFDKECGPRY
jgi:hypothetical protein